MTVLQRTKLFEGVVGSQRGQPWVYVDWYIELRDLASAVGFVVVFSLGSFIQVEVAMYRVEHGLRLLTPMFEYIVPAQAAQSIGFQRLASLLPSHSERWKAV
ncbi:hypothetical protein LEN26_016679 [Aphanomyces euteiches]|nr:hypothetical protein LEN26_016679 [Aphanomyces euteiches]KAH9113005.1 hypothetical protein AeMF1_012743 [Aphanomyces euteiches]